MVIESGEFSVDTAPLIASWASQRVADNEKRRLIFLFSDAEHRDALAAPLALLARETADLGETGSCDMLLSRV
jgi:hypothetical protein